MAELEMGGTARNFSGQEKVRPQFQHWSRTERKGQIQEQFRTQDPQKCEGQGREGEGWERLHTWLVSCGMPG